jgi:hypothetical protein
MCVSYMYTHYTNLKFFYWKFGTKPMPFTVYKVLKYDTQTQHEVRLDDVYHNGVLPVCQNDEYIEYRVMYDRKKYRVVSKCDNFKEPALSLFHKPTSSMNDPIRNPRIISATLCHKYDNVESDVFNRVLKFAGPNHDFFGQVLKTRWMFANDDLMDEEHTLHILYSNGISTQFSPDEHIKKF